MTTARAILVATELTADLALLLCDASKAGDRAKIIRLTEQIAAVQGLAHFASARLEPVSSHDLTEAMIAKSQALQAAHKS